MFCLSCFICDSHDFFLFAIVFTFLTGLVLNPSWTYNLHESFDTKNRNHTDIFVLGSYVFNHIDELHEESSLRYFIIAISFSGKTSHASICMPNVVYVQIIIWTFGEPSHLFCTVQAHERYVFFLYLHLHTRQVSQMSRCCVYRSKKMKFCPSQ